MPRTTPWSSAPSPSMRRGGGPAWPAANEERAWWRGGPCGAIVVAALSSVSSLPPLASRPLWHQRPRPTSAASTIPTVPSPSSRPSTTPPSQPPTEPHLVGVFCSYAAVSLPEKALAAFRSAAQSSAGAVLNDRHSPFGAGCIEKRGKEKK
uniref:Uncharacterized protein n=1 Tax=Oryza sativa subsp. japonica TaxID=39947 RepID=Q6K9G9_ORYSJ|nr:hypothetical protein [Oryza sativa Japonica Group]